MAAPLLPPKNVGPITYVYNGRTATVSWPYFTYDSKGLDALQKQAMPGGNLDLDAVGIAQAIQNSLDKAASAVVQKEAADRKAANDAAYAAMVARNYAQMNTQPNAPTAPTTVVTVSNPIPPRITPFTTSKPTLATKVIVINAKKNSKKFVKNTPKKQNTIKQSSPGKGTPNKNPTIPKPPPPPPPSPPAFPPDKIMQRPCPICIMSLNPDAKSYCPECKPCPPGWYAGEEGECLKCPIGKQYITGSGCSPCPPGTTGESIHTGCTRVGPDGNSYTMIA
jgi:hypothetical protein